MTQILSEYQLRLLEVIGVWSAAFATVFATYIALKIARRQDDIRLNIAVVDALTIDKAGREQVVWVNCTNVARRTCQIRTIGWKMSPLVRAEMFQNIDPPNPQLPAELKDGDTLTLVFQVNRADGSNWYEMFAEQFVQFGKMRRFFELYSLRLIVCCSTGEVFKTKPSNSYLKKLNQAIDRLIAQRQRAGATA